MEIYIVNLRKCDDSHILGGFFFSYLGSFKICLDCESFHQKIISETQNRVLKKKKKACKYSNDVLFYTF